jgi:methylmalonyl-CoA mutase N-terminal domain/subunit
MKTALRTQQIIADETLVTSTIDPLGGSWYVEALTDRMEADIRAYLDRIDALGGTLRAIEQSFFQREIADFAYDIATRKASGELPVIGVNRYVDEGEDHKVEVHKIDPETEKRKIEMLRDVKAARDEEAAQAALRALVEVARDGEANLMPATIEAVKARATMGEIVHALEEVFGRYVETPVF